MSLVILTLELTTTRAESSQIYCFLVARKQGKICRVKLKKEFLQHERNSSYCNVLCRSRKCAPKTHVLKKIFITNSTHMLT